MKPVCIEKINAHDPQLKEFLQQSNLVAEGLDNQNARYYGIHEDNKIVGAIGLEFYFNTALLRSLAIDKDWQGNNYSKVLVQYAIDMTQYFQKEHIYLLNDGMENFFEDFGFKYVPMESAPPSILYSSQFKRFKTESARLMYYKV